VLERGPTAIAPDRQRSDGAEPQASSEGPVLDIVSRLCTELDAAGVRWCHWKSTEALGRSASGENDLDLLVDPRHEATFGEVLRRLGFRRTIAPRWKRVPGVFQAYAVDPPSGTLVQVHAHVRLVVGDDTTKNVHLPIEDAYLGSRTRASVFQVPAPEFELAVLVIRLVLKHGPWDAIATGQGELSARERRELAFLDGRVPDRSRLTAVLSEHLPFVSEALWSRCELALRPDASLSMRIVTAHRLQRALAPYARRRGPGHTVRKIWRRGRSWARFHIAHRSPERGRLEDGGAVVAIVGGDGAGKSTVVGSLTEWLSRDVSVVAMHLGRPARSATSVVIRRLWSLRGARSSNASTPSLDAPPAAPRPTATARMAWYVLTARDRFRSARAARRLAASGTVVICDRYPLPGVIRQMDGPMLGRAGDRSLLARALARRERSYYDRISPPDLIVVLRLDPDVAVRRRPDETPAFVRARSAEVWNAPWDEARVAVVDASRPLEDVVRRVRLDVWRGL
jgi:thymidylate kinase